VKAGYLAEHSKGKTKSSKLICSYHTAMLLFLPFPLLTCTIPCAFSPVNVAQDSLKSRAEVLNHFHMSHV